MPVDARNKPARVATEVFLLPGAAARAGVDLLHSLGTTSPPVVPGRPSIVTILDLIYEAYPTTFPTPARWGLKALVGPAARRADRVITISAAVGDDVHLVVIGKRKPGEPELAAWRDLAEGLAATRGGRGERARDMAAQLERVGIKGAYEGALQFVGNPALISRTHFARFLVETGVCRDTPEVFRRFLTEGKPGYVPHRWATLGDAVRWITGAGGIAVIAPPARYKFSPTEEYALFSEFKQHGGRGVEVVTGSHTAAEYVIYADMAREFGLAASRGSDFHSPDESHTDLGSLPPLPGQLTPVWELLGDRIQPAAASAH